MLLTEDLATLQKAPYAQEEKPAHEVVAENSLVRACTLFLVGNSIQISTTCAPRGFSDGNKALNTSVSWKSCENMQLCSCKYLIILLLRKKPAA